jgi:hypothetical protein
MTMPRGRPFEKGCAPGPGRPRKSERLRAYADAVKAAVTPRMLARILRRLAKRALTGDVDRDAVRCSEIVLKATLGGDPAAVVDLVDRVGELRQEEEDRWLEQEQRARANGSRPWTLRSLADEVADPADVAGAGGGGDTGLSADGHGDLSEPPLFS